MDISPKDFLKQLIFNRLLSKFLKKQLHKTKRTHNYYVSLGIFHCANTSHRIMFKLNRYEIEFILWFDSSDTSDKKLQDKVHKIQSENVFEIGKEINDFVDDVIDSMFKE